MDKLQFVRLILQLILILFLNNACGFVDHSVDDINDTRNKYIQLFNQGNTSEIINFYINDAVMDITILSPRPQRRRIHGRIEIARFWQGVLRAQLRDLMLTPMELSRHGDMIFEAGKYIVTIQLEMQPPAIEVGGYFLIWKRQNGVCCKIIRHVSWSYERYQGDNSTNVGHGDARD